MCGIAGWANLDAGAVRADGDETVLHAMCNRMIHRGPDSEGVWLGSGVALGMRRLSIIDLQTGEQPVYSEDQQIIVVMNGEIYNFRELRADLEKRGHRFETQTDTEVLPHLYEEYGEEMVGHLNGMFAFALWDKRREKFILARDRFGEKPLYYGVFDGKLIFASEPKVLLEHPSVEREINIDALRQFLSFDYVPAPNSIYKNISKLPAAHLLTLERGEIKTRRYWNLSFRKNGEKPSMAEAAAQLKELLADAVRLRLVSDVPLGVLLSGGVDSSSVAAFAQKFSSTPIKTFSIGFEEDSFDESKFAREVAAHLGTEHYEEKLSVGKAVDLVSEIGKWLDEPMSDSSLLPTFLLSQFVRKHVTVALGGDGGDELFAGYPTYFAHRLAKQYLVIPKSLRHGLIEPIIGKLPAGTKNMSFDFLFKRFTNAASYDEIERHHAFFGSFAPRELEKLLPAAVKNQGGADIYAEARNLLKNCDAPTRVERLQFLDMNFYLAEDILTKVDRASMAVSLEVRASFLDFRVAEFAAKLPEKYKLNGRKGKLVLKKAVEDLLPKSIIKRPKKGFNIPIAEWLKGKLNPLLRDLLAPDRIKNQGLFDVVYIQKLISEHENSVVSHHKELWTLMVFQLWFDNFLNNKKPTFR